MAFKMRGWSGSPMKKERPKRKYDKHGKPTHVWSDAAGGGSGAYVPYKSYTERGGKKYGGSDGDRDVFSPGKVSSKGTLSASEQRKIQKTIKQQGHFGDIPPSLMKGYNKGTPEYRRRVAEVNAHHHYMAHANPWNQERLEGRLQEKLANLEMSPDEARNQPYRHPSTGYTS